MREGRECVALDGGDGGRAQWVGVGLGVVWRAFGGRWWRKAVELNTVARGC